MSNDHPFFGRLIWIVAIVMICGVLTTVILTNITLRSVEKNLPVSLLHELNELSAVLDNLAEVVKAANQAVFKPTPDAFQSLRTHVDSVHQDIVALRKSYVFDNLVQASAFHAVVAPAIADLKIWLTEGISGYGPQTQTTASIALSRIDKAYQQARKHNRASKIHAQTILKDQGRRLDQFLIGVNILLALTSLISISLSGLLVYQHTLQRRQKIIVDQLKQTQETLSESEQRFRRIYEHMSIGIARVSLEFIIENANDAYCRMLGYSENELIGKHLKQITHPETVAENLQKQTRLAAGEIDHYRMEKRFVHKSGATVHGILDANLVRDANGQPQYFLGSVLDITEQKQLEMRLQQAQKLESIGNLAGGIAHDFNNILFPIVGMSELLMEDLPQGSQEYKNAQTILKAGFRGRDLVKQILAFSRRSEPKMTPVRLQPILIDALKLSRSTLPTDIEIKPDICENVGLVMADPTQLHQIAMNLITNAFHAVELDGGSIFVQLDQISLARNDPAAVTLKPGRYALLAVSDTGYGIAPDIKDKIFEPYFTTKKQGKGTGLGLAVAYGIVRHFGGDISVYSELGGGSTFKVYLPLVDVSPPVPADDEPTRLPTGNERILLVDDEIAIAQLEKQMLERLGYQVTIQTRAAKALEIFNANPNAFDMVISDMTMPEITGDRLATQLIAIKPGIAIIICTGFSERISRETARAMGISGFLMKPITKSELAQTVRQALNAASDK